MNRKFKVFAAACSVQYIIVNVHLVCDVIIPVVVERCRHLRPLFSLLPLLGFFSQICGFSVLSGVFIENLGFFDCGQIL